MSRARVLLVPKADGTVNVRIWVESRMQHRSSDPELRRASEAEISEVSRKRRLAWIRKHERQRQYAHQNDHDPGWYKHAKHILICSWAGRPIFSRYGDESKLCTYMGVVSAIISNFQRRGDAVHSLIAGNWKFVFLIRGPLYLLSIARTAESLEQLRQQLDCVHGQIISLLTGGVTQVLEARPQYDIRNLLGGTEHLLFDIINESNRNPSFLLNAVRVLRLPRADRVQLGTLLRRAHTPSLMFALVLTGGVLTHLAHARDHPLAPSDLMLIINLVTNSQSLRTSESWTPICLPDFSEEGYLYAYVCFLTEEVSLILLTPDPMEFAACSSARQAIQQGMEDIGMIDTLHTALHGNALHIDELETAVPDLRHFLYKHTPYAQFVTSVATHPYTGEPGQKALFRRYQRVHARLTTGGRHNGIYFEAGADAALLAWFRTEFELYATFTPLVSKEAAVTACNRALRWIRREEPALFLVNPPVF